MSSNTKARGPLTEQEVHTNPLLAIPTETGESELKALLVNYAGERLQQQNVSVEMIIETLAHEFPELVFVLAEENFIRGYKLGLDDAYKGFTRSPEETTAEGE